MAGGSDGISIFDGEHWTAYGQDDWGLPDTVVTSIAFEPNGKPWVGLSATNTSPQGTCGGVSILDGERWMTYRFGDTSWMGIGCQGVQSIQFDTSGNAWIGLSYGAILTLEQTPDDVSQNALPGGPVFSSTFKSTGYFLVPEKSFPGEDQYGPVVLNDFQQNPCAIIRSSRTSVRGQSVPFCSMSGEVSGSLPVKSYINTGIMWFFRFVHQ